MIVRCLMAIVVFGYSANVPAPVYHSDAPAYGLSKSSVSFLPSAQKTNARAAYGNAPSAVPDIPSPGTSVAASARPMPVPLPLPSVLAPALKVSSDDPNAANSQTKDVGVQIIPDDLATTSPSAKEDDSSAAALQTLIQAEQQELVAQFRRRGIQVVDRGHDCSVPTEIHNAIALHWSFIDPQTSTDESLAYFGVTTGRLELFWHYSTCSAATTIAGAPAPPSPEPLPLYVPTGYQAQAMRPSLTGDNSRTFFASNAVFYQFKAPTDFLASFFGLLTLIHPAGHALVAASLVAGISSVSAGFNTFLDSAYKGHDLQNLAIHRSAWQIGNEYCLVWTRCLRVSRP